MEAVRVCWKSGRADPAQGETLAQALIPLSHTGREQQAPPCTFLWSSQVRPRPSADPGTALPLPP